MARFRIPREYYLVDEVIPIVVDGLSTRKKYVIHAVTEESESGVTYESHAVFRANDRGRIEVSKQPSLKGNYTGVSPMGLFWSMNASEGQREGTRLFVRNVSKPLRTTLTLQRHESDEVLATTTLSRSYLAKNVQRIEVREEGLVATVFIPDGNGPFLGVIDMFGSVGGLLEARAALLASRGFCTMALAYFGVDGLPANLDELNMEYFEVASKWFATRPYVSSGGVGVIGVSFGASVALWMGVNVPEHIKAVVSISGENIIPASVKYRGQVIERTTPSYSLEDIEFAEDGSIIVTPCWRKHKEANKEEYERVALKAEKVDGPILFLVGADDNNWPSSDAAEYQMQRLKRHKHPYPDQYICYKGAGHLIEMPYAPLCQFSFHRLAGVMLSWGGDPPQHNLAQEDSWRRLTMFFRRALRIPVKTAAAVASANGRAKL